MADDYDLELETVSREIKSCKANKVLIQLGEGLKPMSAQIQEYLAHAVPSCEIYFWMNSCYGKCDIPDVSEEKFDMIVQFGH